MRLIQVPDTGRDVMCCR